MLRNSILLTQFTQSHHLSHVVVGSSWVQGLMHAVSHLWLWISPLQSETGGMRLAHASCLLKVVCYQLPCWAGSARSCADMAVLRCCFCNQT
jgi:hypothetical protein